MADVREREKIARAIEKTSESIRKKHRALKTGRIEEDIALNRRFKPLIVPTFLSGLYELIFKRIPDDALYTEDDMHKYKSMLLVTNAHKHKYHSQGRLLSNKGYKSKHVIAPLMSVTPKKQKKSGKGLPHAMTLNDNAIDYVHWDDPNELVDRLRLLDASHRAGNNGHDNEMLSIIEELREAGLLIN
ncbi:hypothetical protein ALC56_15323 [Trachymyrmex septentrionalis]|uniref:DUF8207 domain-containing protein n=1 Tax=Trachymyrmex septentrionalis TaxID=34720 RepID=A0A195ER86_9HYME|nr:hypothetical protein ALC56_15323 [Trachymyrmex septentrionalis]